MGRRPGAKTVTDSTLLKAALRYAQKGWPVFPLKPRQKTPFTEHGLKDASTDKAQIRKWWASCPEANIGIPTGPATFDALDLDGPTGV
jgi:hypothetical protein